MSGTGMTYKKDLDVPDIGEFVTFFAWQTLCDEAEWNYEITLMLRSTYQLGLEGRLGDRRDYIIKQDYFTIPQSYIDAGEEQSYIEEEILDKADWTISEEIRQAFFDDEFLLEMYEIGEGSFESRYAAVLDDRNGYELDDFWREEMERLYAHSIENGWDFQRESQ